MDTVAQDEAVNLDSLAHNPLDGARALNPSAYSAETALWDSAHTPTILLIDNAAVSRRLLKAMLKS